MADYFAVLNRTLSGFSDPKPALREKLYDRARSTIRKQLDMRRPAMDDEGIENEMVQLEDAIMRLEAGFDGVVPVADVAPEPIPEPIPEPEPDAEPAPQDAPESEPEMRPEPTVDAQEPVDIPDPASTTVQDAAAAAVAVTMVDEPVVDVPDPIAAPQIDTDDVPVFDRADPLPLADDMSSIDVPVFDPPAVDMPVGGSFEPQPLDPSVAAEEPAFDTAIVEPDAPDVAGFDGVVDETTALGDVVTSADMMSEPDVAISDPLPTTDAPDPLDAWADEFLAGNDASATTQSAEAVTLESPTVAAVAAPVLAPAAAVVAPSPAPAVAPPPPPPPASSAAPLPPVGEGEALTIPPAPGVERGGRPKREKKTSGPGFIGWLLLVLLLLLLLLIGAAFAVPQVAPYRDAAIERLGLTSTLGPLFGLDNPATPTPVKTITITPDAEPDATPEPAPTPAPTTEPKDEDRLPQDDATVQPVAPAIETVETVPVTDPGAEVAGEPGTEPAAAPTQPAALTGASAILYEEGSSGATNQNSFSPGKVTWSLGSEAPAEGSPAEPTINARVEVPDKQLVLLMSIKRNADPALPASHVIELVFATPDTFGGGAISDINRFVLKASEQGRGDNLIGVPARIDEGIFLIALNNLDSARESNVALMRTRDWIDIPLEYRTGRRALMTMEKGEAGRKVFTDAFAAWDGIGG